MRTAKAFQIDIPNPCDEKWANMTPTKGGRHCDRCEKTIVDFTNKTDREIAHLYKQSDGQICGRFVTDQLKRDIILHPKSPSRNKSKAAAALLAGMLSTGTAAAQVGVIAIRTEQHISEKENEITTLPHTKTISGQVTDEEGYPLIGATVFVEGANIGTVTDFDGKYSFEVPENTELIMVSYLGFNDTKVKLDTEIEGTPVDVIMQESEACISMGIVVISDYSYFQDAPRGRTLPQLMKDWVQNLKEKRSKRKPKLQPKIAPSIIENTQIIESEMPDIRPPQIVTNKLITNIFPNPFDDKIHITLESEAVETLSLGVYDAMSREIHTEQINVLIGTNEISLNLKEKQLTKGSYFVSIFRGNEVIQTKVLMRTK